MPRALKSPRPSESVLRSQNAELRQEIAQLREALLAIRVVVADDRLAMSCQTLGQYRTLVLERIDRELRFAAGSQQPREKRGSGHEVGGGRGIGMSEEGSVAEVARTRGLEGRRVPGRRMEEQETIVRFDRAGSEALLYTADRNQANRWTRRGYAVRETTGGWEATVPKRLVSFRRVGSRQGKGAVREVA